MNTTPATGSTAQARLRIAPGDGYVTRRPTAILYTSPGGLALVDAFSEAEPASVIEVVTECAEASSFVDGPFVVISWHHQWRVALYGEIEVVSDHASLSRLSGASSSTWVERQLRAVQLTVGVHPSTADDHTSLEAGTVAGSGFALTLTPVEANEQVSTPSTPPPPVTPPAATNAPAPVDATSRVPRPSAALSELAGQTASRSDVTIDVPADLLSQVTSIDDDIVSTGGRWRLRMIDGPTETVDSVLLLGRRPRYDGSEEAVRLVTVDCALVSSTHLRVELDEADDLVVTDLGSSNGTWIATTGDGQPIQLEPERPTPLEAGTPVQIGSQIFVVERA